MRERFAGLIGSTATAVGVAFLLATPQAKATPAGIHTISRYEVSQFGTRRPPFAAYSRLSSDGSIALSLVGKQIWSYSGGPAPVMTSGTPLVGNIVGSNPDMSLLLVDRYPSGSVVIARDGSRETVIDIPLGSPHGGWIRALSPSGEFAAGPGGILSSSTLLLDVGRWSARGGFEILDKGDSIVGAKVVSVTDEGMLYALGYVDSDPHPTRQALVVDRAVRWTPDGTLEDLAGVDAEGTAWRQTTIHDISPDGSIRIGRGEIPAAHWSGNDFVAVFDDSGVSWMLWDERVGERADNPYDLGITRDGALAYGHTGGNGNPSFGPDAPMIYTREGGRVPFEVFLRSMGIDTSGWEIGAIIDMSEDGRTFLTFGSKLGEDGYQLLIAIPEPGSACLLGFGLGALAARRARVAAKESDRFRA